jgi:tetratricopeptide (TPR) repeat protein
VGRALGSVSRSYSIIDRNLGGAIELAREALAIADEAGDDETASIALNTIGMSRVLLGEADGIDDLELSAERAARSGSVFHLHSALNNLANLLRTTGRLAEASARLHEAGALCERYGLASALSWNEAELVYDCFFRGDIAGAISRASAFLAGKHEEADYQTRGVLSTRGLALLVRGEVEAGLADAERALAVTRAAGADAQALQFVLADVSICLRAAGRVAEADELLAEVMEGVADEEIAELPLELVELGRGDEYLAMTAEMRGHSWLEAGRAAASGDLGRAAEIYGRIGARFFEAWAALLAAERGDTSRLDAALAYFEEQRATPYVRRCRALLQASA